MICLRRCLEVKSSLIYMYNVNKKQIIISLLSFIFVVAVAFVTWEIILGQESGEIRQIIIVSLVILVYIIFIALYLFRRYLHLEK